MAAYNPRKAPRRNVTKAQAKAMTSQLARGPAKKKRKSSKKKGKKMTKAERSRAAKKGAETRATKKAARSRAAKKGAKTRARGTKKKTTRKGKKKRSPAQIAATKRMLAAAAKKRGMTAQAKGFSEARKKLEAIQVSEIKSLERKVKRCEKSGERKESTISGLKREIRSLRARMGAARRRGDLTKKQEGLLIKRLQRCQKKLGTAPKKVRRKATKRKAAKRKAPARRKTTARKTTRKKTKRKAKRKMFSSGQIARKAGCVLASARPSATYGASSCKPKKAPPRTIHQAAKDLGKKRHGRLRPRLNPARIRRLTSI